MLKIGVLGAGHLGKIHLRLLKASSAYELAGFYDTDRDLAKRVADEFGYTAFDSVEALIDAVDVVDIVTPTVTHYDMAEKAITKGKHVFLEKPIAQTVEEARQIQQLCSEFKVKGQVGHVERFNSAFTSIRPILKSPMFIEAHRLAEFNPRGTDVPVVLDLMIHDIDLVLKIVDSEVVDVKSSGVSVISETPDIANARIEFANGCVANLTASRISLKKMRKLRFFQKDAYISVDFNDKKCEVVKMKNAPKQPDDFAMILQNAEGVRKQIYFDNPEIPENNAIADELEAFAKSIREGTEPIVSLEDGTKALEVAQAIIDNFKTKSIA